MKLQRAKPAWRWLGRRAGGALGNVRGSRRRAAGAPSPLNNRPLAKARGAFLHCHG